MREIKFRIIYLDKDEKKAHNNKYGYWTPENPDGCIEYMITSPEYQVDIWTGLKDKNGKEIYEGDILRFKFDEEPGIEDSIVFYKAPSFASKLIDRKIISEPLDYTDELEIIGNKCENSEMLEKKW